MIWYPYQQMKTMKAPFQIVDAQGVYLRTPEREMIDSVSSWWSVIHGYKHPTLTRAIQDQAGKFCHVMLGGLTHEPVQKLSAKLEQWLPGDLDCCFFSDSGSVAVEVSLKMALQYYMNRGDKSRTKVLALEHAYHGDTFKAMEVGDDEDYHFVLEAYGEKTDVIHIPTRIDALEEAFVEKDIIRYFGHHRADFFSKLIHFIIALGLEQVVEHTFYALQQKTRAVKSGYRVLESGSIGAIYDSVNLGIVLCNCSLKSGLVIRELYLAELYYAILILRRCKQRVLTCGAG